MRIGRRLYSLAVFVVVAALGGLLIAGLAIPAVSLMVVFGTGAATTLQSLPLDLPTQPMSERSRLLNADGSVLTYFYDENRVYVPLDKIARIMVKAQVAIEDHRFYDHGPIDVQGTLRALFSTSQGVTQGASSITQQYVRLVLVDQADRAGDKKARKLATENTLARKIRELRYAAAVEEQLTKDQILERYLNISYYGDGAYGVEAAARHYFGVAAKDLNLAQAAMLAGAVRNPVTTNPVQYPSLALERRDDVVNRMLELGLITSDEAAQAKATPFDRKKVREYQLGCANSEFPFICDYAWRTMLQTPSLGANPQERRNRILRGGLTIQTQIDRKAQLKAEQTIHTRVSAKDPAVSVIVMVEPSTGQIVTMAQNRNRMGRKDGETFYNYAVSQAMGGADGYQGGSTFKAFVAAAALEDGLGANITFDAKPRMSFGGQTFKSCDGPFTQRKWDVVNSGGKGRMNMYGGVRNSVNTYFAQLIKAVGVCDSVKMAKRLGLEVSSGKDIVDAYQAVPSFTLGAVEVTPLSLVSAYSTFANRGVRCNPVILKSIKQRDGSQLDVPSANCQRVISQGVADAMNDIFQGPYRGGTATRAQVPGVQMAGKTGTVPRNRAIWTMGYTPELAAGAMISYDNNPKYHKFWAGRPSFLRYTRLPASGTFLTGFSGGDVGQFLLKPAFATAIAEYPNKARFQPPPRSVLLGEATSVPSCAGVGVGTCRKLLEQAGFSTYVTNVRSALPKGTVLGTNPSGQATRASSVGVLVSDGKAGAKQPPDKGKPPAGGQPTPSGKPSR